MKLLILSTDPSILNWKSLSAKVKEINKALPAFTVEVKTTTATPLIVKGRIDHDWLNSLIKPYFNKGHDIVAFHFNTKQKKQWGIIKTLRGSNPNTPDEMGDLWFVSDEDTLRKGLTQFAQTLLHEVSHEFYQETKLPDITHTWHNTNPDIKGLVLSFDWGKYQPRRQELKKEKNRLERLVSSLVALLAKKPVTGMVHPVEQYKNLISQEYGRPNPSLYPQTGHHIGTDYACPVGTPVLAPWDGQVTVSGTSAALGNFCHYKYTYDGVTYVARFMHLSDVPPKAKYKRGEVIELSGKTGKVSGPHLHQDIWYNDVRLDLLTAKNWNLLTIDPYKHYAI
jgi:hypothetical protein